MASNKLRETTRRPYKAPVIKVYGDIRTITATIGNASSAADGGVGMGSNKTH